MTKSFLPKRTIFMKLFIPMVGLILLLQIVTTLIQISILKTTMIAELNSRISLMKINMMTRAKSLSDGLIRQTTEAIVTFDFYYLTEKLKSTVIAVNELDFVIVMDKNKRAIIHTKQPKKQMTILNEVADQFVLQNPKKGLFEYSDRSTLEIYYPITISNKTWGFLRLGFSLGKLQTDIASTQSTIRKKVNAIIFQSLILLVLFVSVGAGIVFIISKKIANPIITLTKTAESLANEQFDAAKNLSIDSNDEVGTLATTFKTMAEKLKASKEKLEEYNRTLEDKVKERTQQLEEAHTQILKLEKDATEKQMAGGFAHEIRNALAGIKIVLSNVQGGTGEDAKQNSLNYKTCKKLESIYQGLQGKLDAEPLQDVLGHLKEIFANEKNMDEFVDLTSEATERALSITNQIMTYSKIGQNEEEKTEVKLANLIQTILDESKAEWADANIQIKAEWDDPKCSIMGIETHFYSIFKNLILNAKDAVLDARLEKESPKIITITQTTKKDQLVIEITDTGIGIKEEKLPRIYDAFYSTKPNTGTGLGLSMVKKYVDLYQGTIEVESKKIEGTTFTVLLHLSSQERG